MKYPQHLHKLIDALKQFPGVGTKSAERFAFEILGWEQQKLSYIAEIIATTKDKLKFCKECGSLTEKDLCHLCQNESARENTLCIVATARDLFSIEATHGYSGLYHVLGGLLSPLDRIGPEHLNIDKLKNRIVSKEIKEVILALDSTLEGDATSLYIKQELEVLNIKLSRLAFGLPLGSSFDYVDGGTLAKSLSARGHF